MEAFLLVDPYSFSHIVVHMRAFDILRCMTRLSKFISRSVAPYVKSQEFWELHTRSRAGIKWAAKDINWMNVSVFFDRKCYDDDPVDMFYCALEYQNCDVMRLMVASGKIKYKVNDLIRSLADYVNSRLPRLEGCDEGYDEEEQDEALNEEVVSIAIGVLDNPTKRQLESLIELATVNHSFIIVEAILNLAVYVDHEDLILDSAISCGHTRGIGLCLTHPNYKTGVSWVNIYDQAWLSHSYQVCRYMREHPVCKDEVSHSLYIGAQEEDIDNVLIEAI